MRLLIDECLSPALVPIAHAAGYEAFHVAHRGWSGKKDSAIFEIIVEENFTLVRNNRDDFGDLVRHVDLHAGLVVIIPNVPRDQQVELFQRVLAHIQLLDGMINRVVEVGGDGIVRDYLQPPLD